MILTHPHQDHLAGLVEVLKRYKVKTIISPSSDYASPVVDEWQKLVWEKGIESIAADTEQQIEIGDDTLIKILNPPDQLLTGTESDVDNNSVVVQVQEGDFKFLVTGDIMQDAELNLIRNRADVACTVLKVAHHGSDTSITAELLAVADPQIAVVSSGLDNKFGYPKEDILARLDGRVGQGNLYRTDTQGTIAFTTDGEKLWVKTEK